MADFVIIANPASGTQAAPWLATRVRELLQNAGKSVDLRVTTKPGDAHAFAKEAVAAAVPAVVGCGGDGTLQEIATALDSTPAALGLLPSGRCNDFANALGLTGKAPVEDLVSILLNGRRRAIDLGSFRTATSDKRFLTVATMGFDSEVSRFVETHKLWLKGTTAYLYAIGRVLSRFRSPLVRLKGDFGARENRMLLTATGNAPSYGGAMRVTPGAKLDDGVFQICSVRDVSVLSILFVLLPRLLKGTHVTHPAVTMLESRTLDIETPEGPQWVCADGETLGQTPCTLEVRPKALQVIVPAINP